MPPCPTRSMVAGTHAEPLYVYVCHFFCLRAHLFVLAPLSKTSDGVGTIRPSGSRCRRFGRDPCSVSRVASLLNFFGLGYTLGKSPGSATSPGIGFLHLLSPASPFPVYARNICMQTGFFSYIFPIFVRARVLFLWEWIVTYPGFLRKAFSLMMHLLSSGTVSA